ncbi:MAG: hypothetical protein H7A55_07180 [Verrucomicrobiaceae bacterium]|nr:hypothetical protein [Verrucomicrobiaceae bacterium]
MKIFAALLLMVLSAGAMRANVDELIRQGDAYDAKHESDNALKYYLPAEKLAPDNASLMIKIARQYVYRMEGLSSDADKLASGRTAVAYSERAIKLAPSECDAYLSNAICWGKITPFLGNKESIAASRKIQEAAEKAVKLNPRNDYAWHMLGRWHQELAGIGGMTRTLAKLIYGALPDASFDEALRCFEKAIALNPGRLIHTVELGRTYAAMGNETEARKFLEKGLAMPNREKDDPETKRRGRATLAELN